MGRNNDSIINSDSLGIEGGTHLNCKEVQEGEELLQQIGWMTPVKTTTPKLMETNTEPTIEGKEMVHELKVTDQKILKLALKNDLNFRNVKFL